MTFNAESAEALATAIAALIETIHRIDENTRPGGLRKEDICRRYLRCSMTHARSLGPWVWPNFGESDVPGKPVWFLATCESWYSVTLETHKAEYYRQGQRKRSA